MAKKGDRGAVGSSMLSLSSNEEIESKPKRTTGAPKNVASRNPSKMQHGLGDRRHTDGNLL